MARVISFTPATRPKVFPDDPLCDLFTRAPAGRANEFNILTVRDPFVNIDTQHNKSLDFTTRFRQDLGNLGSLSILGQLTYQLKDKFTLFQGYRTGLQRRSRRSEMGRRPERHLEQGAVHGHLRPAGHFQDQ